MRALFARDRKLFEIDPAERAIAAQMAFHLVRRFADYHVDVEYNRMGDSPKQVVWSVNLDRVYPDIIVHRRQKETNIESSAHR